MEIKIPHGYKTYIVAIATVCYALGGLVSGFVSWQVAVPIVLVALGFSGLAHKVERFFKDFVPQETPGPQ